MCPFGDTKDIPDYSDESLGFFIVVSSCAIYPLSKMVLNLSVDASSAELHQLQIATQALWAGAGPELSNYPDTAFLMQWECSWL